MGYEAKKTEQKGNGAYRGPKQDAKKESNKFAAAPRSVQLKKASTNAHETSAAPRQVCPHNRRASYGALNGS